MMLSSAPDWSFTACQIIVAVATMLLQPFLLSYQVTFPQSLTELEACIAWGLQHARGLPSQNGSYDQSRPMHTAGLHYYLSLQGYMQVLPVCIYIVTTRLHLQNCMLIYSKWAKNKQLTLKNYNTKSFSPLTTKYQHKFCSLFMQSFHQFLAKNKTLLTTSTSGISKEEPFIFKLKKWESCGDCIINMQTIERRTKGKL